MDWTEIARKDLGTAWDCLGIGHGALDYVGHWLGFARTVCMGLNDDPTFHVNSNVHVRWHSERVSLDQID